MAADSAEAAVVAGSYEKVYGLTGSIACGKTTVANLFVKYGIPVVDLDNVSRDVVKPGSIGLKKIIAEFGKEFLTDTGTLDRKKLAKLIFDNKKYREKLEKILHPLIFEKEREMVKRHNMKHSDTPIIIDAALMIETGSYKRYKKIIVVYTPEKIQIQRLINRECISEEQAKKIILTQMSIEEKVKYADFLIDNSKSLDDTEKQVKKIALELI